MLKTLFTLLVLTLPVMAQTENPVNPVFPTTSAFPKVIKTVYDGCNTTTYYEGGWATTTLLYCPEKSKALVVDAPGTIFDGPTTPFESADPAWKQRASIMIRQPQSIGLAFKMDIEGQGSGNSTIRGVEVQSIHHIKSIDMVNNFSLTWDKKIYLNQFGVAPRLHTRFRWHLPMQQDQGRFFLQTGFNASAVQYTGTGGYAKYGFQPVLGFGMDMSPSNGLYSLVGSFSYNFHSPLYGQASLANSTGRVKDGWTVGQTYKLENITPFKPGSKWGILANVTIDRTTYTRSPETYGPVLGNVPHRFVTVAFAFGIARFY